MRAQQSEVFMQNSRGIHAELTLSASVREALTTARGAQEHMKQKMDQTDGESLEELVSNLESELEDGDFKLDDVEFKLEEVSGKVEDLEGQLADAKSRIDDRESEDR